MKAKRVWIYCRTANHSFLSDEMERQRMALQRYAEANGLAVAGMTMEHGGGLTLDRPGLRDIEEQAKAGQMDALLIWDFSRLGRDFIKTSVYIRSLVR